VSREARAATELRRALWRHEYGHLSATRIRRLLRAEYQRALAEFGELAAGLPAVRRHDRALLDAHDRFRAKANAAVNGGRYREALDELLRGRHLTAELRALSASAARVDQAGASVRRLHDRARTPGLRVLPCVTAPARLLELARDHLARKRYSQALHLADASIAEAASVGRREHVQPGRVAAVQALVGQLRALCASTGELSARADPDPLADGSLDAALALAREGYAALAERMVDELAFSLAERGRFHREMQRAAAGADDESVLRGALDSAAGLAEADVWASVTATLWRSRMEAGLRRAAAQRERLDRAAALSGPAPPPTRGEHPPTGEPSLTENPR
jgi:hypothetical protein